MAKKRLSKTSKKKAKERARAKKKTRRKQNPNLTSKRKLNMQKIIIGIKTVIQYYQKENKDFGSNKRKVLLPDELLEEVRNILRNKISLCALRKQLKYMILMMKLIIYI